MARTNVGDIIVNSLKGQIGYQMSNLYPNPTLTPGDEGYIYLNRATLIGYELKPNSVPARLDFYDPKKLLTKNAFGNYFRLTGANGGYYDYTDGTYRTRYGALSTKDAEFLKSGDYYIVDNYLNLGIVDSLYEGGGTFDFKVNAVLGETLCGYNDLRVISYSELKKLANTRDIDVYGHCLGFPPFSTKTAADEILTCSFPQSDTSTCHFIDADGMFRAIGKDVVLSKPLRVRTHFKN